jgi:hypothetical protein
LGTYFHNHIMIDLIWREINTPSGLTGPLDAAYRRAVVGMGHALLGAAFSGVFGGYGLGAAFVLALAYWLAKERGDLRRGGDVRDGLEDALMVSLGAFYGPWWWPAVMVMCGGYLMFMGARR